MRNTFAIVVIGLVWASPAASADETYVKQIKPLLTRHCIDCHSGDKPSGGVSFESEKLADRTADQERWSKALRMARSGLMPPKGEEKLPAVQVEALAAWIKRVPFAIDPQRIDPGHVTLRRLNKVEYRNTIRDLLGIDYDASADLPPDNTGHGFDNVADSLTLSTLAMEKYIAAAQAAVALAVPTQPYAPAERRIGGGAFALVKSSAAKGEKGGGFGSGDFRGEPRELSYYEPAKSRAVAKVEKAGRYQLVLELVAIENFVDGQFDYNKCRLTFRRGEKKLLEKEFVRQGYKKFRFEFDEDLAAGPVEFTAEVAPLTPNEKRVRNLRLRIEGVTFKGPMAREHWVRPAGYEKAFPGDGIPADPAKRAPYVRDLLAKFVKKAFRRPVDDATVDKLARLAETAGSKPDATFEGGVARAMTAALASPRFLFREETAVPSSDGGYSLIDEHALAARLSYFFWSTMPDAELTALADAGKLRANQAAQVKRLLADPRAKELTRHFVGQWLQTRNVDSANVNAFAVLIQDEQPDPKATAQRERFRQLRQKPAEDLTPAEKKELEEARAQFGRGFGRFRQFELTGDLRRAMRQETESCFEYVLKEDRSLLELLDADYTFLNERLAKHYGIDNVVGDRVRKVTLPKGSPRGGVVTQASSLVVTSNPNRTSPVKRGLYILDNILGTPPPPPPPDIAALEESARKGKPSTLKETLARHRADAKCASCHNRMDPLGLALENFNALGRWRDKERGQPIETGGELLTGERFKDVQELKRTLTTTRRLDFYRCLAEKLFTYALGRGPEPCDTETLDRIVTRLDASGGKPSELLTGILESPAFQRQGEKAKPEAAARAGVE